MNRTPIANQVAIVTGGGSGIGHALCVELASRGAAVIVSDIRALAAQEVAASIVAAGGRATAVYADVSRADTCNPWSTAPSANTAAST